MKSVFELVCPCYACVCRSISKRCSISQLTARGWPHVFRICRAVRDAHAEASGAFRVLFSQLLATLHGRGKLPILFRDIVFLQRKRVYPERELCSALLTSSLKAVNVISTSAEPEKMQFSAKNTSTRGVRACIASRRLWQYSSNDHLQIFPQNIYRYPPACMHHIVVSRLLNALRLALPQFPDVPALTARLSQYATSFARPGFNIRMLIPSLFEDAVRVRASGELCRAAEEFGCTPEIGQTSTAVNAGEPAWLAGTTASTQALVVRPQSRSLSMRSSRN